MKVQRTKKGNLIVKDRHTFNSAVIGMVLGDGSFDRFRLIKGPENRSKKGPFWNRTVLRISHKLEFEEYLNWKITLINPYIDNFSVYKKVKLVGEREYRGLEAVLRHRKNFHYRYKDFYIGGGPSNGNRICGARKVIKERTLNRTNDLTIAIWYMDDGSLHTYKRGSCIYKCLSLHTDCFTEEECYLIKSFFHNKYGVDFNVNHNGMTGKKLDRGFKLRMHKKESIDAFIDVVKPFVSDVKCMNYKLPL